MALTKKAKEYLDFKKDLNPEVDTESADYCLADERLERIGDLRGIVFSINSIILSEPGQKTVKVEELEKLQSAIKELADKLEERI